MSGAKFRNQAERNAHFRSLEQRTDRQARRNRYLMELDRQRLERALSSYRGPLPSRLGASQSAER